MDILEPCIIILDILYKRLMSKIYELDDDAKAEILKEDY